MNCPKCNLVMTPHQATMREPSRWFTCTCGHSMDDPKEVSKLEESHAACDRQQEFVSKMVELCASYGAKITAGFRGTVHIESESVHTGFVSIDGRGAHR